MNLESDNQRHESDTSVQRRLSRSGDGIVSAHCAAELGTRLEMLAITPQRVACLGWDATLVETLNQRWPKSSVVVFEANPTLAARARKTAKRAFRKSRFSVETKMLDQLSNQDGEFQFAVANLTLARSATPDGGLAALAQCLQPSAGLLLACPGPDTLRELRDAWADDTGAHTALFPDMHDLGSAFARHGFTESVLNVERLTLEYRNLRRLWEDLTDQGARNSEPSRRPTLTGRKRFRQMCDRLKHSDAGTAITIELIYAQTWRANSASADRNLKNDEIRIGLDQLTRR